MRRSARPKAEPERVGIDASGPRDPFDDPGARTRLEACDREAWADLVEVMHEPLRTVARAYLRGAADVEDAVAEVWARAVAKIKELRPGSSLRAWLYRVCRNRCLDVIRKRTRRTGLIAEQPPRRPGHSTSESADPLEIRDEFEKVIEALPSLRREVVRLRFVAQLSVEDVADCLSISKGAVYSHIHRALKTIQEVGSGD